MIMWRGSNFKLLIVPGSDITVQAHGLLTAATALSITIGALTMQLSASWAMDLVEKALRILLTLSCRP